LRKLENEELDKISEIAVKAAENFIFKKVSKKEITDLDIRVEIQQNDVLNVDVSIDIISDEISTLEDKIVDEAADHAIKEIDKIIDGISIFKEDKQINKTHRQDV